MKPRLIVVSISALLVLTFQSSVAPQQIFLYPIVEKGKWGYIDDTGKVAIQPQFDDAKNFSEGLARVKVGEKWGFIDQTGRLAVPPQFEIGSNGHENDASLDFHEGMAVISLKRAEKWGYVDQSGRIVIPPKYDSAHQFSEGLASVGNNYAHVFHNSSAVYLGGLGYYIDKSGRIVDLPLTGGTFSEGLAIAGEPLPPPATEGDLAHDQKFGYIDRTGHFKIAPRFWAPEDFSEGLARVRAYDRDLWGYIDHKGTIIIRMQYEGAGDFSEGLARVKVPMYEKMGFINKSGRLVITPAFLAVGNFSGGLASACVEDDTSPIHMKCGYIDKAGHWAIAPTFIFLLSDFKGNLAFACTDKTCGYVNRAGQFVWQAKSDEPTNTASSRTGCSILSDKSYRNYPCTIDFKLF
jgi:hypothetical protein